MKLITYIFCFVAPVAASAQDSVNALPVRVPDGGSTFLLLSIAVLGLAMAARKRILK